MRPKASNPLDTDVPEEPSAEHLAKFLLSEGGADRALLLVSVDGSIIDALGAATGILGGEPGELRGVDFGSLLAASATSAGAKPRLLEQVLAGRFVRRRCWCVRRDRSRFWGEVIAAPILAGNRAVIGATVAVRDLTELRTAESATKPRAGRGTAGDEPDKAWKSTAAAVLDGISNALFAVDDEWRFVYANARCAQMLRKPREQLIGAALWEELPVSEGSYFHRQLQKTASERIAVQFEEYYPLLNAWFEVHAYPFSGGVVVYFWDISDRKLEAARSRQQSLHDPLTGVANTLLFQDRAANAVARATRTGATLALVLVDIDGLGGVNSKYGHTVGDLLLQTIARRLSHVVRRSDTLARLGGDEFAILTSDHREPDGPAFLAEKVLAAAAQDFNLPDAALEMSASIGIALFPADGKDAETLAQAADAALAAAKAQGGNTYRFFSPDQTTEILRRRAIESDLRVAIAASELDVVYQPERSISEGEITAMEALLRWNRTDGTLARPGEFMPALYATDVVVKMDNWVLREACKDRRKWLDAGLSADLVAMVRKVLDDNGLDATLLELEFSQPALAGQRDAQIGSTLQQLHELGVGLSLDDVGRDGWASLTALEHLPFTKIKIDPRDLVDHGIVVNQEAAIRAASSFAHAMNRRVVAEGVESAKQLAFMRACGCDAAQGDFIGIPIRPNGALPLNQNS
jgi:diguanylate cyclase (GGDEF)-like protein/PAS domain S-box-containing protein